MVRLRDQLFAALLVGSLLGCAMLQASTPPLPKTLQQSIILSAYETAAVVNAASDSFQQGLITRDTLETVVDESKAVQASLQAAREALAIDDLTTAQGQLRAAQSLLGVLRGMMGGGTQ